MSGPRGNLPGYRPAQSPRDPYSCQNGYTPTPSAAPKPQGGYRPTTGEKPSSAPMSVPQQPSSVQPPKKPS
jgi:hypothetical protein